jgi:hypothetical protein
MFDLKLGLYFETVTRQRELAKENYLKAAELGHVLSMVVTFFFV